MAQKRLLMVDDNPELGEIVRFVAEELGYEVIIPTHGKEFMQQFDSFKPTTVVIAIVMPNIDGIELIQWLHERECKAKILVTPGLNDRYAKIAKSLGDAFGLDITVIEKSIESTAIRTALAYSH